MLLVRAIAVWLLLMAVEVVHGIARSLLLAPLVGDFRARQIAVATGSLLILLMTTATIRWMRADTTRRLLAIGMLWVVLTLAFEVGVGRFVAGYSWDRIASDYDLVKGGLLPLGLAVMALSPLLAKVLSSSQGATRGS
jgi:hypothetical protein